MANPRELFNFMTILCVLLLCFCYIYFTFYDIDSNDTQLDLAPVYKLHPALEHLNCSFFFDPESEAYKTYKEIKIEDPKELSMTCDDIKGRQVFSNKVYTEEAEFPLAFVRAVYKDYVFHENELAANYNPNNVYCYVLDSKADDIFKQRIRSLGQCFTNVLVAHKEFKMMSGGENIIPAQQHCLELLLTRRFKYVIIMENFDMLIKTNYELVKIFQIYNGSNDVSATSKVHLPGHRRDFAERTDWSLQNLQIFRNTSLNSPDIKLVPVKSLTQSVFSFEAVDYMYNVLNLNELMDTLNGGGFNQELFTGTLNANEALKLPGGFTTKCLDDTYSVARFSKWGGHECRSKNVRHGICILGMKDLFDMYSHPDFTANKMLQDFDFGGIGCWHERMYNRQHFRRHWKINLDTYRKIPHVRYHNMRKSGALDPENFNCTTIKS